MSKKHDDGKLPLPLRLWPEQKRKWLLQSRAEDKPIGDWVADRVEAHGFKDDSKPYLCLHNQAIKKAEDAGDHGKAEQLRHERDLDYMQDIDILATDFLRASESGNRPEALKALKALKVDCVNKIAKLEEDKE